MFDEMSFLFETGGQISKKFNKSLDIRNQTTGGNPLQVSSTSNPAQGVEERIEYDEESGDWKQNKYTVIKSDIQNYIKSNVNAAYQTTGKNPYIALLEEFNGNGKNPSSLKLKASDFAYLRDIGVFPINRLMILRRFSEGVIVPTDLNSLNSQPIATIIGWVKQEDPLLNFSVNEVWKTQSKWLHELIQEIIQNEFGVDIGGIMPIPGWGQGFMFGLLNKMGLTDYDAKNLPIGDANLLREGITREHEGQGLLSSFDFVLETVYEQKFIGGIDAGAAFNDILTNAMAMGTSNIRTLGTPGNDMIKRLTAANNNPNDPKGWVDLIVELVTKAVDAITETITETVRQNKEDGGFFAPTDEPADDTQNDTAEESDNKTNKDQETLLKSAGKVSVLRGLIQSVLASTVARYQWPIRGAVNQLTGQAATPWHLTIGNPYAPLLSINNIKVNTLDVTMGNELAYNDMSKFMTVKVTLEQGRNLGKQEIERMFGIEYKRKYKKV